MSILFSIFIIITFAYSQCNEGEVEIWESCYVIETTTQVHNSDATTGEIPEDICLLENLEVLDLEVMFGGTNYVWGIIPECIGDLQDLRILNLGWNALYGEIPESIGNLTNLTFFNVIIYYYS